MNASYLRAIHFALIFLGGIACPTSLIAADTTAADNLFETHIRPVLIDTCVRCHGPSKQQHGLRLDSREALLKGGDSGPAIVPGKPQDSLLIKAIRRQGSLKMPPNKPLSEAQIAAFSRWIELGANWPTTAAKPMTVKASPSEHWAFQPVKNPTPPTPRDLAWVRTPVDRFILSSLESAGLAPSPSVDRRTLIRRVTYDLTGLPPTFEQVEAFVSDPSPDAYAKLVERLLASRHYGEQWGRHWLDVARYSDTKGYVYAREERFWIHAWAYRDWVVKALNEDMPYDRFLAMQLAADQLAPKDTASQAAMGYLTLNRRFLGVTHDIADDRIDTVTRGMLGLTVACARCHDHKFDPIPTADYYSLYGVFRSSSERDVVAGKIDDTPAGQAFAAQLAALQKKLADTMATRRAEAATRARAKLSEYLLAQLELSKYPEEGFDQILAPTDIIPATVRQWRDYLARTALRRDPVFAAWHAFAKLPADGFATQAESVLKDLAKRPAGEVNSRVMAAFATPPKSMREVVERYITLFNTVEQEKPIAGKPDPMTEAIRAVLHGPNSPCEVPDQPIVDSESFFPSNVVTELWKLQGDVDRHLINSPNAPPCATVLVDRPIPMNARILRRGNPATPTTEAPRRFLQVLAGPTRQDFRIGSGRLELAQAIANPNNPLTARVMVNRIWLHHFGAGLVRTPSDFGTRAEAPSHPELLDWLATQFTSNNWSMKAIHRQIVLSATYQQSSIGPVDVVLREKANLRDPENKLLWRMNPRRLTFEELRDSMFAVTGELNGEVGGKATDLFAKPFSMRRSIYGVTDRQFFPDLLRLFDTANPDLHIPQRSETTVPQQALFFLNHPLPLDRARALAMHPTVTAQKSTEAKVRRLYQLMFQREPTTSQTQAAVELITILERDQQQAITAARPTSWKYGVGAFDAKAGKLTGFTPLPYFTGNAWQGGAAWPDATFGWAQLTATGGHPGNDHAHAVVRRWTATTTGKIAVNSLLIHEEAAGDGVRATIISSRHGILKTVNVHHSRSDMNILSIDVQPGDTLDFVVDILGVLNTDQYLWSPTITQSLAGKTMVWDAKSEFNGPATPKIGAWEQLAQAFLMTNEFSFID